MEWYSHYGSEEMNSFKYQYLRLKLEKDFFNQITDITNEYVDYEICKTEFHDEDGEYRSRDNSDRNSKACFIDDPRLYKLVDDITRFANSECKWNLDIDFIEPLQHTLYEIGGFYGWHIDESNWMPGKRANNRIRKISFSLLLNDDFTGGDFEIQTNELNTITLSKGEIIFFHGDTPHRVKPVETGVRRSLVGWIQGPAYK